MGLGILEPSTTGHVPGTKSFEEEYKSNRSNLILGTALVLDGDHGTSQLGGARTDLKYGRDGSGPFILVPQPSDDPNDPLVGQLDWFFN